MVGLDRLVDEWQQAAGAPSLSVAVFRRGAVLHSGYYGDSGPETLFQTASLGKHFTAALALFLAARSDGPMLDAPVAGHLGELPEGWGGITFRQLLSHTAGVPSSGYDSLDFARDYTDSQIVSAIGAGGALDFRPGTAWNYSNAGYVLAGIAIGRKAGAFYGDLLRELIFTPLGMTTATVNSSSTPVGYVRKNGDLAPATFVSPTLNRLADGGLCLSLADYLRSEAALWGDWSSRVGEMFVETILTTGERSGYGLGWFLTDSARGRVAEHDGAWQGFSTAMVRYLDEGYSAVVLANVEGFDAASLATRLVEAAR